MANKPNWSELVATPAAVGTPEARAAGEAADADTGAAEPPADSGASDDGKPPWRAIANVGDPSVPWPSLTGQNMEGSHNAFDTAFWETAARQDEEQSERGLRDRFTRPDATGVAVYDDPKQGLEFGDVFLDGQKQGNLLKGYGGLDKFEGEQMMARLVLPREVVARSFEREAGRPATMAGTLSEELDKKRKENSENFAKGVSAQKFEGDVRERAEGYEESDLAQAANVGTGAAGGALTAGSIGGLIAGPPGALLGGLGGGIVGGVGAWLNRDEQFRRIAEAQEQFELAKEAGATSVGVGDAISGWAGVGMEKLSPLRNFTRGVYDAAGEGGAGDQRSRYSEEGGPLWFDVVDTAGLVVDGIGTFGSRAALSAYTAVMGTAATSSMGSVVSGAAHGNLGFNPYTGQYEDIGAVGTGLRAASAGIDFAQTAVARGLSSRLRPGGMRDRQGGFQIYTDSEGVRRTGRIGFSALIPSEAAVGMSARMLARRSVRRSSMEPTKANLARETARHIDNLTAGRKGIATTMVNAFGEGTEEFVQAGLDALSVGETPTFRELVHAAREGAAMGAGMGMAVHRASRSRSQQWRQMSNVIRTERGEDVLTDAEWDALSETERAMEGTPRTPEDAVRYAMLADHMQRLGGSVAAASVPELQRAWDVVKRRVTEEARNSQDLPEPARLATQANFDFGPQDVAVSLTAAIRDVRRRFELFSRVARGERIRRENGQLVPATPEQVDYATRVAATDSALLAELEQAQGRVDQALATGDLDAVRAETDAVNDLLRDFWSSREDQDPQGYGKRRSVSFLGTRFPLNSAGSTQLLRLQVSSALTIERDHHTALVPNEIQPMMGGDFDGDEINNMLRMLLPDESYQMLRHGASQLTSEGTMMKPTTYMVSAAEAWYDALQQPVGSNAQRVGLDAQKDMRTQLIDLLDQTSMDPSDIQRLVSRFVDEASSRRLAPTQDPGQPKHPGALARFLDELATRYAEPMRELADALDASPWLRITRTVEDSLRDMANALSLTDLNAVSTTGGTPLPAPSAAMRDFQPQPVPASSETLTGAIQTSSWNMFRLYTIFKYNPFREPTRVTEEERAQAIQGLIERFTLLNDGLPRSGDEAMFEGLRAHQRSMDWLTNIAEEMRTGLGANTLNEALVMLAGSQVPYLAQDAGATDTVTMAQAVLREVVIGLRREYEQLASRDEAVAMRLDKLELLTRPDRTEGDETISTAGSTFVELFAHTPIYELLGDNGANLSTWTVRALRDHIMELRPDVRREFVAALKKHPQYSQEVTGGGYAKTPYRVLVDQVVQSANMELYEGSDGLVGGHAVLGRPDRDAKRNFTTMHDSLRAIATARNVPHSTRGEVREFLNSDPALAAQVLAIMEDRGLYAGLVQYDENGRPGKVQFPQWIYDVLAEPETAKAEMMLLRNTLIFSRASLTQFSRSRIEVDKVSDRILRLWLDLDYRANDHANPKMVYDRAARDDFLKLLYESNSTDVFIRGLNQDYRFRTERTPPYMAWNRDRSAVEADRFGRGVSDVMDGQEMREALREASDAAVRELQMTEEVDTYLKSNAELLDQVRSARDRAEAGAATGTEAWTRFKRWFDEARSLPTMISMSVMVEQAAHINEILGGMGAKGVPPENVEALGRALAAQLPTFDSAMGRLLASVTSASVNAALTDMTQLARGERTFVMNDGTVVNWEGITAEQALDMLSSKEHAGLAARMMGLTAWDLNSESGFSSLTSMLGQGAVGFAADPEKNLFSQVHPDTGRLTGSQLSKFRRLAILEARASAPDGVPRLPVLLAQQMNLRETAAEHVISPRTEERQHMAVQILEDIADAMQYLASIVEVRDRDTGLLRTEVDEDTQETLPRLNRVLRKAGRRARRESGNVIAQAVGSQDGPVRDAILQAVQIWLANFAARAAEAGDQASLAMAANLKTQYDNVDNVLSPVELLVSRFKNFDNPLIQQEIVDSLASWGDVSNVVAWARPEILRAVDPSTPQVTKATLQRSDGQSVAGTVNLPDMTDAQWETLARAVIAFTMHTSYGIPTTSGVQVSEFPSLSDVDELNDLLPYWDPSGVSMTLNMFAPGVMTNPDAMPSSLLQAQMELQRELGPELPTVPADVAEEAIYRLFAPVRTDEQTGRRTGVVGQWHALLPALYHSAVGAVMSSPAEAAVQMAGKNPQRLRFMDATTHMDWDRRPPDEELSTVVTDVQELVSTVEGGQELDVNVFADIAEPVPSGTGFQKVRRDDVTMASLEGRVVRSVKVNMLDGSQPNLLTVPRFAPGLVLPAWTGVPPGEAGVLSLKTLSESVAQLLAERGVPQSRWHLVDIEIEFFHPRTKAASSRRQGTDHDHNAWFDGVRGRTEAAFAQRSHLGLLYFGLDGMIPAAYERSLQSIKKLHSALQHVTTIPESTRRAYLHNAVQDSVDPQTGDPVPADIQRSLDQMTRFMLQQKIDGKRIPVTNYNSLRKLVELLHVVRYIDANGLPHVVSVDTATAMQQRGEDFGPHVEMVGLPIEHVLALMGEQDLASETFAVNGMREYTVDISRAKPYLNFPPEAWTDTMFGGMVAVNRDDDGNVTGWATTDLLDYEQLRGLPLPKTSSRIFDRPPSSGDRDFYSPFRAKQTERQAERANAPQANTRWAAQRESTKREAERRAMADWAASGESPSMVSRVFHKVQMQLQGELDDAATYHTGDWSTDTASHDYTTGWLYVHRGVREGSAVEGVLTSDSEAAGQPALGDTVHVMAESFMRPDANDVADMLPEATRVLEALMGTGTTIRLPPTLSAGPLRARMVQYLHEHNYVRKQIGSDEFVPQVSDATSQAEAAYHSMLNAATYSSSRNRVLLDLSDDNQITEGGLYSVNGGLGALEDFFVREVVQTARYAGYTPTTNHKQDLDVIRALKPILESQDGLDYLYQHSGAKTGADKRGIDRAVQDLLDRMQRVLDDHNRSQQRQASGTPRSLQPHNGDELGTGDFIPLVSYNPRGELVGIHLYRHGHRPASEELIRGELPAGNQALGVHGARLTIDQATPDDQHTTHRGTLVGSRWLGMHGFIAQMRVLLSNLGSKVFEAGTGMKWTTTPPPDELHIPGTPVFAGTPVLGAGDLSSPEAKNSDQYWLNSPDRVVEAVGFDVMPHLVRAIYGESADVNAHAAEVQDHLRRFVKDYGHTVRPEGLVRRNTTGLQRTVIAQLQRLLREITDTELNLLDDSSPDRLADVTMLRLVASALAAGAPIDEVLHTPGYIGRESGTHSHTMHPVLTTLLEQLPADHPAKAAYVEQINNRMAATRNSNGDGYYLNPGGHSWTRRVTLPNGDVQSVQTMLAYTDLRNADSNDALSEMAEARRGRSSISLTTLAMEHTTWGASAIIDETEMYAREIFDENPVLHGSPSQVTARTFNIGAGQSPRVPRMDDDLPMNVTEQRHIELEALPSRQALSVPIDDSGWYEGMTKAQKAAAKQEFDSTFERVRSLAHNLPAVYLVEMIRAAVVRPASLTRDEGEFLTRREALAALRLIERNLTRKDWPLHGAPVNVISRDALQYLYERGYPLRAGNGRNRPASDWNTSDDSWVEVMLSHAFTDDPEMRGYPATTNIIDGVLHEYRKDVKGLPVTTNPRLQAIMRVAMTRNQVMISSPVTRLRADRPGVQSGREVYDVQKYDSDTIELDDLPQTARAIVEQRMVSWESKKGISRRRQSPRAEAKRGAAVRDDLIRTNVLMRHVILGYVLKAFANIGLWVAAFIELFHRGQQERVVSFLSGQNMRAIIGDVDEGGTPEQQRERQQALRQQWRDTRGALSRNSEFYQMLYDHTYWDPSGQAETRFQKRLQRLTNFLAASVNDPTWGTRDTTLAQHFMEAAWDAVNKSGDRQVSLEQFLDTLATNPSALESISSTAVQHGYARIAYRRNLQDNLLERTRRWMVRSVINSGGPGTNTLGVLLLHLPTMFFRFRSNHIINMLGMQGPHAMISTLFSERTKRPGGLKDKLTGADEGMDPAITDYASVEDSVDLTRAIIRSGVSHTQLFMLGSLVSSLFSGDEDEEERLLTKLRRYQQTPVSKDPLSLENDFRNAEAWFLDMLPGGLGVPNWTLRIFVSPMMGIARFHETGDFRQVYWGFSDALGSMPLLNLDSVFSSWEVANQLQAAAEAEAMSDNVEATTEASRLLVTSVGVLENMLFESAFASMLYQAGDEWDRDPYVVPAREDGELRRDDVFGEPIPTDAVQDIQDGPRVGEQGYVRRTDFDAAMRGLAENRPVLAHALALINRDSTYLRQNMVPKTREQETEQLSEDEAQTLIMSIVNNETGREELTDEGGEAVVRGIRLGTVRMDSPALQGVHIPRDMRQRIQTNVLEDMTAKYLELGMSSSDALNAAKEEFYGQGYGEPEALGFADILWDTNIIPERESHEYMQLNTTYVIGPNGRPVATGLQRSFAAAMGVPWFQEYHAGQTSNMPTDPLLNSVDKARGANLGLRGLVKTDESWVSPTSEELAEGIQNSIDEISEKIDELTDPLNRPFNYGSGGGFGGGGFGGSGGYSSNTYTGHYGGMALRLNAQRRVRMMQYGDDLYSIRVDSPYIRRSRINKQRFESRRGRLKQWQ